MAYYSIYTEDNDPYLRLDARAGMTLCTPGKTVPCGKVCRTPANCRKGKKGGERVEKIGREALKEYAEARKKQQFAARFATPMRDPLDPMSIAQRAGEISLKAYKDAEAKAKGKYPVFNEAEHYNPSKGLGLADQRAIHNMARGSKIRSEAEQAANQARLEYAKTLPSDLSDNALSPSQLQEKRLKSIELPPLKASKKPANTYTKTSKTSQRATGRSAKPAKTKTSKRPLKLPTLSQISDYNPMSDRIVNRGGRFFIESDLYAPIEIQPFK